MKKLLIILFTVFFILSGCSAADQSPATNEINEPVNEVNNNEINEDKTKEPEAPKLQDTADDDKSEETLDSREITEEVQTDAENTIEGEDSEEPLTVDQADDENALKIQGLAENELSLSLDELKAMNDIIFEADFYSLNNFGTTGYTHFKGVKLWDLLESKALMKPEASKISITAQDGYSMDFTLEQVKMEYMDETNPDNKYPMIIAWEENGQEYSTDEGAPYKLVVGQKEAGDINKPQWVSNIDIVVIE